MLQMKSLAYQSLLAWAGVYCIFRYEETRRSLKRPADERDRRDFFDDRKRPATDSRGRLDDAPAPPRR